MSIEVEASNPDFNALKTRIAHLQQELSEINQILDRWAGPVHAGSAAPLPPQPADPLRNIQFADKEPLRKTFDEMFERLGIEETEPVSQQEFERILLNSGIRPEDNILSRGIIEMREE